MGRGRPTGYVVTHGPSSTMLAREGETIAWRRCRCGRPFYAETSEAAQTRFDEHLDRMESLGRPVDRSLDITSGNP